MEHYYTCIQNPDGKPIILHILDYRHNLASIGMVIGLILFYRALTRPRLVLAIYAGIYLAFYKSIGAYYGEIYEAIGTVYAVSGVNRTIFNHVENSSVENAYDQYILSTLNYHNKIYAQCNSTSLNITRPIKTFPEHGQQFMQWNPTTPVDFSNSLYLGLFMGAFILNVLAIYIIIATRESY